MPRDPRPYTTYPLNYTSHPRIASLSDAAFRVFHLMNDYSRVHGLDGVIPIVYAKKAWPAKALTELVTGIDDRPLVVMSQVAYILRSYAEHQFTSADMESLREKRASAGAAGGKAKAERKQAAGKPLASATANRKQSLAESESESELQTDVTKDNESGQVSDARFGDSDSLNIRAKTLGIGDLSDTRQTLEATAGEPVTMLGAVLLAEAIISKSKRPVDNGGAYVATVCRNSSAEVQRAYFDLDIGGLSDPLGVAS